MAKRKYISPFTSNYEKLGLWNLKVIFEDKELIEEYKLRHENIVNLISGLNNAYPYLSRCTSLQLPSGGGFIHIQFKKNKRYGQYFYISREGI